VDKRVILVVHKSVGEVTILELMEKDYETSE
jgi:hypothetical protein